MHRESRSLSVGDVIYIRFGDTGRVLILIGVDREENSYTALSRSAAER